MGAPLGIGVSFFFVLSGFILTYVYPRFNNGAEIKRFYVARFARIWPAHFVVFIFAVYNLSLLSLDGFGNKTFALMNLTLMQSWVPMREIFFSFNSLSWTLSVETFFYLLFPFLIKDFEKNWPQKLLLSAGIVVMMVYISKFFQLPAYSTFTHLEISRTGLIYINPLSHLFEFVLGMALSIFWQNSKITLHKTTATLIELCLIGMITILIINRPLIRIIDSPYINEYLGHSGMAIFFGALIFVMAFQAGFISSFLEWKTLVFLGEISYTLYIFHQVFLRFFVNNLKYFSFMSDFMSYLIYWALLMVLCPLIWLFYEQPVRKAILNR